jgi:death-on-curing protein
VTHYLTPEQVLFIHYRLIQVTGGETGVRDVTALRGVLEHLKSKVGGKEKFPGLYLKAAVLLHGLITNQPFVDGNNRAAFVATGLFLHQNNYRLVVEKTEAVHFTLKCSRSKVSQESITAWLWQHARPE